MNCQDLVTFPTEEKAVGVLSTWKYIHNDSMKELYIERCKICQHWHILNINYVLKESIKNNSN